MLGSTFCLVAPSSHARESIAPYSSDDMSVVRNRPHHVSSRRTPQIACPSPTSNLVDSLAFQLSEKLDCILRNLGIMEGQGTIPPLYSPMTTCRLRMNMVARAALREICRTGIGYKCTPSAVHRRLTQSR